MTAYPEAAVEVVRSELDRHASFNGRRCSCGAEFVEPSEFVTANTVEQWNAHRSDAILAALEAGGRVHAVCPDSARLVEHADRLMAVSEVNDLYRTGLQQIVDLDYPAEAGEPGTWAQEILDNPHCVRWEEDEDEARRSIDTADTAAPGERSEA